MVVDILAHLRSNEKTLVLDVGLDEVLDHPVRQPLAEFNGIEASAFAPLIPVLPLIGCVDSNVPIFELRDRPVEHKRKRVGFLAGSWLDAPNCQ